MRDTTATSSPAFSPSPRSTRSMRTRCHTLEPACGPGFSSIERIVTSTTNRSWRRSHGGDGIFSAHNLGETDSEASKAITASRITRMSGTVVVPR